MNAWQDKDPLVRAAYELKEGMTNLGDHVSNAAVILGAAWIVVALINQAGCS